MGPPALHCLLDRTNGTVKIGPVAGTPEIVKKTLPVVAPEGTDNVMLWLFVFQEFIVAEIGPVFPLNVTAFDAADDPKFVLLIVTEVSEGPCVAE